MDWQLTCRVCLESGDMVSLFDWDENNEQLGDKYTYCCGVEVTKSDSLPTLICLNCVDRLTYAYQFKQQCLASNDTLKECLQEFLKTSAAVSASRAEKAGTETITIKQENGLLLQYELPVEHDPQAQWTRTLMKTPSSAVVAKAPGPRKRGRPRKYPNEQGAIDVSPYQRKKPKPLLKEQKSLTTILASGSVLKEEPGEDDPYEAEGYDDPDFDPGAEDVESEPEVKKEPVTPKKRGRPRKNVMQQLEPKPKEEDPAEDVLLKETIMAFSEPIPEHILNPKPKKKKKPPQQRKKYIYEKTHICETCGASFTSNASLQAHIRRHLGIKPFVCSVCGYACVLNMELRRHMMRHTGVRPYKCRVCDRRFGDFGSRQKHESVCGYSCVLKEALKRHMFKHTGEKPYKCRICDRRYGDYGTRQKHERLHMGLRPYQCSLCGKAFTYSYVLANHMLTHTGEKKYSCAPCNKKFTKAHHLKYHNKVHHKEVYQQQQLEQQARKIRQQLNVNNLSDVIAGQLVDGTLQLVHANEEGSKKNRFRNKKRLYSRDAIGKAINAVHKQGISVREAAKKYGVPRSTIQFKIKNPTSKLTSGPGPILTNTEEDALCAFILNLAKRGIPIKKEVIQLCVQSYLKKNPRPNPFTDDKPGDVWFKAFLKRHPIITTLEGLNNTSARVTEDDKRLWLQEFEEYFNEEELTEDVEDVERKYIEDASADETDGEQDPDQMQVVEEEEGDSDNKETDRAIAGMEGVVLDAEFSMDDDEKSQ